MRSTALLLLCAVFIVADAGCYKKTSIVSSADSPKDQWSRGVWLYSSNCASCHGDSGEGSEDVPSITGKDAFPHLPPPAEDDDEEEDESSDSDSDTEEDTDGEDEEGSDGEDDGEDEDDDDDEDEVERTRTHSFDTAEDIFKYVKETMPPLDVGALSDDQLYAVMNYLLKQADVKTPGDVTKENIASIKLR